MTKRFAFTLAEVLIALAIIGVVAAMTIPTFMANTAGAQFRTAFKKGITVLTQAASANYATEGYDFGGTNGAFGASNQDTNLAEENNHAGSASFTSDITSDIGLGVLGFDTQAVSDNNTYQDRHPDTPSLFHLFQNNLNMKNSHEVANYAVMPSEAGLNCGGKGAANIKVPGEQEPRPVDDITNDDLDERIITDKDVQSGGGLASLCLGRALNEGGINQGYMFQLEDGMVFTYDPAQAYCTESNPCYGYIDVNGPTGPNRQIACSEGDNNNDAWIPSYGRTAGNELLADCTVEAKDITDIYPVLFYGSAVKPASRAAKSVLYSKKSNQVD